MYGGLEGIIGNTLPRIKALELGSEDGVVFICYLKDSRSFIACCSPEIYNKLVEFGYE